MEPPYRVISRNGELIPMIDNFEDKYAFLSNFYPAVVRYPDYPSTMTLTYPTVEHAYQAAKTLDINQRVEIQRAPKPGVAKRMGQEVTMRPSWNEQARISVMSGLLRQKFTQEPFRSHLLATDDAELVEGNTWHDQFWGDCRCDQHRGMGGLNWLGELLMKVRREIASDR